jgi:hypothetical protein
MNKTYTYRVKASYNDSTDLCSQPVQIFFPTWVKPVRTPFFGAPFEIPGTIEAEDFDKGGQDFTYHDADASNIPGKYRPDEAVDIYDRLGTGFHIGNAIPGEWYEYSIDIQTEGLYNVTAHLASVYRGGKFQITIDTIHSDIITMDGSGSNLNTKPFTTEMYLYPGKKIMRFIVISDPVFNIDKITFELKNATGTIDRKIEKPFFVYQNRSNEIIITQKSEEQIKQIGLYSLTGSLLKAVNNPGSQTVISVNNLPSGIYIIQASGLSKRYSEKIVINQF